MSTELHQPVIATHQTPEWLARVLSRKDRRKAGMGCGAAGRKNVGDEWGVAATCFIPLPRSSYDVTQLILQGQSGKSCPNPGQYVSCMSTAVSLLVKDVSHA